MMELERSFTAIWSKVANNDPIDVFNKIAILYSNEGRYYHNLQHISSSLEELSLLNVDDSSEIKIALAIWFHDVIYNSRSTDNEEQSGAFFKSISSLGGMDKELQSTVFKMILATKQHEVPPDIDSITTKLFLDIDLAILGADDTCFREYHQQIRSEYSWVPSAVYEVRRKDILRLFLEKDFIYFTDEFRSRYEQKARMNLRSILDQM